MYSVYIFILLFEIINAFNIDTKNPIVYVNNKLDNSYFGYTVQLYPKDQYNNEPGVMVGAPRDSVDMIARSGAVYRCKYLKECLLQEIPKGRYNYIYENSLFGSSMDIDHKGAVTACAPNAYTLNGEEQLGKGICGTFLNGSNSLEPFEHIRVKVRDRFPNTKTYYYVSGFAEAGFSLHVPKDSDEVIMGAPGFEIWAGMIVKYVNSEFNIIKRNLGYNDYNYLTYWGYSVSSGRFFRRIQLNYVASTPRANEIGSVTIFNYHNENIDIRQIIRGKQPGEYFGYSMVTGDLNNDGLDDLIIGSPFYNSENYNEGKIYIYLGSSTGEVLQAVTGYIEGASTNGHFGMAIQYLNDINEDSFGDIAVSAPYEADSGVLYIYRGNENGLNEKPSQRIVGSNVYPNLKGFGTSISKSLDVDGNGYKDIAVGACLSESVLILRSRPIAQLHVNVSLASPQLSRTDKEFEIRACYKVKSSTTNGMSIKINRYFTIDKDLQRAKLKFSSQRNVNKDFSVGEECEELQILTGNVTNFVDPLTVKLSYKFVDETEGNPVVIFANYTNGTDKFCPNCPILDEENSSGPFTLQIPFKLGCGPDDICDSRLDLNYEFLETENNEFVLGSAENLKLRLNITNTGEFAYSTKALIHFDEMIYLKSIPPDCEQNDKIIDCEVDNPLLEQATKSIVINLDTKNINRGKYGDFIAIRVKLVTFSNNKNNDSYDFRLKLTRQADLFVTENFQGQSHSFGKTSDEKTNFTQIFKVENSGVSLIERARIEITVPYAFKDASSIKFLDMFKPNETFYERNIMCKSNFKYLDVEPSSYAEETLELKRRRREAVSNVSEAVNWGHRLLDNTTIYINCSTDNVICEKIVCYAGPFDSELVPAFVALNMVFDSAKVRNMLGKRTLILFETFGKVFVEIPENFVQTGNKSDSAVASTLFVQVSTAVLQLWIILVSVAVGFILLLLLIVVLIKAGFFKRSRKEELEKLKAAAEIEDGFNDITITENSCEDLISNTGEVTTIGDESEKEELQEHNSLCKE